MTNEDAIRHLEGVINRLILSGVTDKSVYQALVMAIDALEIAGRVETIRSRREISKNLLQVFPDAVSKVKTETAEELCSYLIRNGYVRVDQNPIKGKCAEAFTAELKVILPCKVRRTNLPNDGGDADAN